MMKKLLLLTGILFAGACCMAQQIVLKGHINGAKKGDSIEVNVPYDGFYWQKSSAYAKPDAAGNFRMTLPYQSTKFVQLAYNGNTQYVLLTPGRDLKILLDADKLNSAFNFAGVAKPENDLLKKLKLEDVANLGFVKDLKLENPYTNWSVDSVLRIKLPQIKRSLDSTNRLVTQAALPLNIKTAISAELKYLYAMGLTGKVGGRLNNRKNQSDFNLRYIDVVISAFGVPTKEQLAVSISANNYLDDYLRYRLWNAAYMLRTDKDTAHAARVFKNDMGVAFADLSKDPDRNNEVYMFTTRLKTIVPVYAWEKRLTNLLFTFRMQGQLQSATKLMQFIRNNCKDKQNIVISEKIYAPLKLQREQYANNLNIKIRPDYRKVSSVTDLLAPYKGKVVFIDMWGTWCPHCIDEMVFAPAMKERLKGKDVVYLYLARDEDADDEKWRDFIIINNLTGEHVRRNADQMALLWNQFGVPDTEQAYPHYFIFNKDGKMVEQDAKRPSTKEDLYKQIEKYL